jgi:perosamine synthetase
MIPIVRPALSDAETSAAVRAIESGWISHGPRCVEFEQLVAARLGVDHARAVNSCTNGILLTLLALGLRRGDEVIVPAFTCVAALNPIEILGAVPVPVDIELEAFGMTTAAVANAITERTRGVLFAHLFGLAADVQSINALCKQRGLWLVEDIALGFGASFNGSAVGSHGDAAVLSFHPRKLITTGEGGMVASRTPELIADVTALRNYGASRPAWERHNQRLFDLPTYAAPGLNCKLTDIQAAIGIEQVRRIDDFIAARTAIAMEYHNAFEDLGWASPVMQRENTVPTWQSYALVIGGKTTETRQSRFEMRDRLLEHLAACGVSAVQGAQAMHNIDFCRERHPWRSEDFPNAEIADRCIVCLPIFPGLSDADRSKVIESVVTFNG